MLQQSPTKLQDSVSARSYNVAGSAGAKRALVSLDINRLTLNLPIIPTMLDGDFCKSGKTMSAMLKQQHTFTKIKYDVGIENMCTIAKSVVPSVHEWHGSYFFNIANHRSAATFCVCLTSSSHFAHFLTDEC